MALLLALCPTPLIIEDDCNISIGMSWLNFIVGTQTPSLLRNKPQHGDHLLADNVLSLVEQLLEKKSMTHFLVKISFNTDPEAASHQLMCASGVK